MLKLETAAKITYADLPDFEAYIVVEDLEKFKAYKNNYSWLAIDSCIKQVYAGRTGVVLFRPLEDIKPFFLVAPGADTSYLVRRLIGSDGSLITSTEKRAEANYSTGIEKSGCRYRRARFDYAGTGVKWIRMHRLVLAAFAKISEDCKELKLEVDHRDGNPANNSLKNLELVTHSENMRRIKFQQMGVAF